MESNDNEIGESSDSQHEVRLTGERPTARQGTFGTDVVPRVYLQPIFGYLGAIWGVSGAMALLGWGVARMVPHCLDAMHDTLGIHHWIVLVLWTVFMAYSEGYRGFQRGFSPRVAARALYLRKRCTGFRLLMAPFFCMGFFDAPRRRRITVFVLVVAIALLVILFRLLPQPWRGVLDFGVVVGLSWGVAATLFYFIQYFFAENVPFDAEVPTEP
ncbi:MAG: hypothetical protein ABL921_06230 [Pirellula sp.]